MGTPVAPPVRRPGGGTREEGGAILGAPEAASRAGVGDSPPVFAPPPLQPPGDALPAPAYCGFLALGPDVTVANGGGPSRERPRRHERGEPGESDPATERARAAGERGASCDASFSSGAPRVVQCRLTGDVRCDDICYAAALKWRRGPGETKHCENGHLYAKWCAVTTHQKDTYQPGPSCATGAWG